ncbi:site-specific integrase [Aeromonas veronii]|uniref:site-specific integrase n=1 Tax=Aeromonas veronii TaxID=654 RepID=UPI001F280711|nr:site-specific integrase [Aeromonas veronii]MCF5911888.1 site-specific integrase [Aeromonas veronii]
MFLERRNNGIWYYKKTWVVDGARKVTRKSLNTYDKKEAQLRAMQLYFNVEGSQHTSDIPTQQPRTLDDGFVVPAVEPELSAMPMNLVDSLLEQQEATIEDVSQEVGALQLQSIVDAYIKENGHLWGVKETNAYKSLFNRFIKYSGIAYLEQCTKQKAVEFKQSLITSGLSNTTINKFIGKLSNLFDYIHAHYEHSNIFDGLKIKRAKQETTRTAYTKQEAQELIKFANKQQQQHHKFMVLLGLYTGCRANELAQLYTSDIVKVDNVWSILIQATKADQKLKTKNASRIVPVHSELIKQGFIEFVKSRGQECRLFPEFKYSAIDGCSKAFVQWFIQHKPVAKTYHEIRHSFATQLRAHDVSLNVAAQLLGHGTGSISFDRYGSTAQTQIHILKEAIEHVSYE